MATITKRAWKTSKGEPREAWLLAYTDANGKRHKEQFEKKRDADAARVKTEGQVAGGTHRPEASKHTVADACDRYLKYLEGRHDRGEKVTKTYLATTRAELENYVVCKPRSDDEAAARNRAIAFTDGIGHLKLRSVTPSDVDDLATRLRAKGVSVTTTRRALASLSRALAYAITKNLAGTNAARGVKVIGTRSEGPKKIVPPSKESMRALLKAADSAMRMRLQFAALTGLRASEQWALRWRHIDLEAGTVTVETRLDRYGVEDTTKSVAGQRTMPIGRPLVDALKQFKGDAIPDDLVFPVEIRRKGDDTVRRTFTNHGNMLKRQFQPLLAKAGQRSVGWHSLRHFAVSTWIEDGRPPKTVQTWAGHATLAITMDRYGHMFPSDDHQTAMDRIAEGIMA